ncbi:MFS transporter [Candidatus Halocynthiibacter alkanivorans]|uniref:MFS transporter n=1 Tax=Candidatus Halocynthiibacter alkanivorans TaxID=2267619 RepID=UPI00135B2A89|nr:MFS transporter [Candidatus Halocynthiibacter alkanivorans]
MNFVGTLGFSIVTPFLVVLVTRWGGNAVVYGVMAATYSFFQLFGAPVLGQMSDRIGRRKVLLLSQAGTLLSWAIFLLAFALPARELATVSSAYLGEFALTLPLVLLFLARAADGLTGGNVSVSSAYLADITRDKDRSKNFGRMAMSSNLGFILGPALAGLLGATLLGEMLPVLAAFLISALALLLIRFGLADVKPAPIAAHLKPPSACAVYGQDQKRSYRLECAHDVPVLALPGIRGLLSINFLVMLGFSFFYAAFPVHAVQWLGWSVTDIGLYFAALSLVMVMVQGPLLSWAGQHFSDRVLMSLGGVVLSLGFGTLLWDSAGVIYGGAVLIALGNGLMWPTFMAVLSRAAGKRMQGAVQGYSGSIGAAGSILGLVGGGVAYVSAGAWIFLLAALVILLAALLAARAGSETPEGGTAAPR